MKLKTLTGTPAQHGFHFPAEWAKHRGTIFSWPRPEGISFPTKYHTVPANLAAIIREIAPRETVHINIPNENYEHIVREQLISGGVAKHFFGPQTPLDGSPSTKGRIQFHYMKSNEAWCRDHGPAFVVRKRPGSENQTTRSRSAKEFAIVDWGFNAWGGKYPPYDADDAVPTRLAEELARRKTLGFTGIFYPKHKGTPVVMEGGSVEINGQGTLLTTEACLLHKNRNPTLTKEQIEKYLKDFYGQSNIVWLGDGIVGDDTDGHIDDLSRFIGPRTIVTGVEHDPRDANYKPLRDNLRRLELARDEQGRPFIIISLPMPAPIEHQGQRLPASYANFYFVNGALLLPTYRDTKNDRLAADILQRALIAIGQNHKVISIDCHELIWGLGSIHCLTQQFPA